MDISHVFKLYVISLQSLEFSLLHFEIMFQIHLFDIFMHVLLYTKRNAKRGGLYIVTLIFLKSTAKSSILM